jgi:hypothetical protein
MQSVMHGTTVEVLLNTGLAVEQEVEVAELDDIL